VLRIGKYKRQILFYQIMKSLFEPISIRSIRSLNRVMMSPMCQYCASDGKPNTWHLVNYGSRAVGKVGIIMVEATAVEPEGRITPYDLGLYIEDLDMYREIASFVKSNGSVPAIQLAHAGRKASTKPPWDNEEPISPADGGWVPVAPSAIAFSESSPIPRELSVNDIENIENSFAEAAYKAYNAGFEVVEIHAAHGYLAHQFLSPVSNHRTDRYGGSFENRTRFLIETVDRIRERWPDTLPLFVRISATDWIGPKGWTLSDSIKLAKILNAHNVDVMDVSTGGILPDIKIPAKPGYQVPFSREIKKTGMKTVAVGIIYDAFQAEQILERKEADMIAMGRELLRDPYWPLHAAKTLKEDITWPIQYQRAKR
jgi:2,4-dienoyl-CoA reductase-like NADH-dependent reductase (Old Yellow Enzyme family)